MPRLQRRCAWTRSTTLVGACHSGGTLPLNDMKIPRGARVLSVADGQGTRAGSVASLPLARPRGWCGSLGFSPVWSVDRRGGGPHSRCGGALPEDAGGASTFRVCAYDSRHRMFGDNSNFAGWHVCHPGAGETTRPDASASETRQSLPVAGASTSIPRALPLPQVLSGREARPPRPWPALAPV